MNLLSTFTKIMAATFGKSESVSTGGGWIWDRVAPKTNAGVFVTEMTAINLPIVYACVSRISSPIGMFPVDVFRRDPQTGEAVQDKTHPLNAILNLRPNKKTKRDKICLSFYITAEKLDLADLKISGQDWYFNYWLAGLIPLYDRSGIYDKLMAANSWIRNYLSNWEPLLLARSREIKPIYKIKEQGFSRFPCPQPHNPASPSATSPPPPCNRRSAPCPLPATP